MRSYNLSEQRQQWLLAHSDKSIYCLYALIVHTLLLQTCLALMRKQNDWNAAASQFEYFPARAAERAEAVFNTYAIAERTKVERETVAKFGGEDLSDARQASNVRPEDVGKSTQV
jgi:uncharacterized membrane protein